MAKHLHIRQKRPAYVAKKTYVYGKRDLRMWQKRPGDDELHAERVLACARLPPALDPCVYVGLFCHICRSLLPHM